MKNINIKFRSTNYASYSIKNGKVKTTNNDAFFVKREDNEIIIFDKDLLTEDINNTFIQTGDNSTQIQNQTNNFQNTNIMGVDNSRGSSHVFNNSGNSVGVLNGNTAIGRCGKFKNISISPNKISFNGYEFNIVDDKLMINGNKFKNGKKPSKSNQEKEDEYFEYKIEDIISSIELEEKSILIVQDLNNISKNLLVDLNGQSDFYLEMDNVGEINEKLEMIKCKVLGQSSVNILNTDISIFNCKVLGQSRAYIKYCNISKASLNASGQSRILIKESTLKNISKNSSGQSRIEIN